MFPMRWDVPVHMTLIVEKEYQVISSTMKSQEEGGAEHLSLC